MDAFLLSSTNRTTNNNSSTNDSDTFTHALNYASIIINFVTLAVNLFYSVLIFVSKKLRKRQYLYLNHANFASLFYAALLAGFSISPYPNIISAQVSLQICRITEVMWLISKYIRVYSVLLIAAHRYLAVFKFDWYKRLNSSLLALVSPLLFAWLVSVVMPIASKYIFGTTVNPKNSFYCLDGYSSSSRAVLSYFILNYTLLVFAPTFAIVFIYVRITQQLNLMRNRLKKIRAADRIYEISMLRSIQTASVMISSKIDEVQTIRNRKRANQAKLEYKNYEERCFANQFLSLCLLIVLAAFGWSIFQLRNIIPDYFSSKWINWRIFIRMYCALMLAANPIMSLCFLPTKINFVGTFFNLKRTKNSNDAFL